MYKISRQSTQQLLRYFKWWNDIPRYAAGVANEKEERKEGVVRRWCIEHIICVIHWSVCIYINPCTVCRDTTNKLQRIAWNKSRQICLATLQTDYCKQKDCFLFILHPKPLKRNQWKAMKKCGINSIKKHLNPLLVSDIKTVESDVHIFRSLEDVYTGFHAYLNCPNAALPGKSELSCKRNSPCQGDWYQ